MISYKTIDEYINTFPKEVQVKLQQTRNVIIKLVPNGEEAIRYGMPTIRLNSKNLVHFAAFKNHIGFYPTPSAITKFEKELSIYKTSKGAIQFPIDKNLPPKLIEKIVKFRIDELNKIRFTN